MAVLTARQKLTDEEAHIASTLHLLGDTTRFKIFKLLLNNRDLCVSEIAAKLGVSVPAVSQHFRVFELCGLVDRQRSGQKICYAVRRQDKLVKQLTKIINV